MSTLAVGGDIGLLKGAARRPMLWLWLPLAYASVAPCPSGPSPVSRGHLRWRSVSFQPVRADAASSCRSGRHEVLGWHLGHRRHVSAIAARRWCVSGLSAPAVVFPMFSTAFGPKPWPNRRFRTMSHPFQLGFGLSESIRLVRAVPQLPGALDWRLDV